MGADGESQDGASQGSRASSMNSIKETESAASLLNLKYVPRRELRPRYPDSIHNRS